MSIFIEENTIPAIASLVFILNTGLSCKFKSNNAVSRGGSLGCGTTVSINSEFQFLSPSK